MGKERLVHLARTAHVEDRGIFRDIVTVCTPVAHLNEKGTLRQHDCVRELDEVTCQKCIEAAGAKREAALALPQDDTSAAPRQAAGLAREGG